MTAAHIRRLQTDDADEMAALHATSFDPAWPAQDMRDHVARDIVLGVEDPLTGFIILRPAGNQAEVLTIVTEPTQRGQGLGYQLMIAAEREAARQNIDILFLEVAEDNTPALALYRACGFEQFGKRPGYYKRNGGRVAALTFRKKLDAPSAGG